MPNRKKSDYTPHIPPEQAPPCHVPDCGAPGVYKAPKSREALHDYRWFCLDHIREHNQQWDYFSGMDSGEIESFIKDAVTGHRPTWSRESKLSDPHRQLEDALYAFLSPGRKPPSPQPPLSAKLRRALLAMEMEYPYTPRTLKAKYRAMVKRHHPDMNKGNKQSEEKFKQVTAAYHLLAAHIKSV